MFQTIIFRAETIVLGIEKELLLSNLSLHNTENTEINIDSSLAQWFCTEVTFYECFQR